MCYTFRSVYTAQNKFNFPLKNTLNLCLSQVTVLHKYWSNGLFNHKELRILYVPFVVHIHYDFIYPARIK